MPVLYSPLISSTPRTPIANCARLKPARLVVTGLNVARSLALNVWYSLATTEENNALTPIISATAISRVQTVERTERNFVHSERRIRRWVTFTSCPTNAGSASGVASEAVIVRRRSRCS